MRRVLLTFLEALFRVLFLYDCDGDANVPATGPAVVAANHPSYLDPALLSLRLPRPIRFMAWDALFRVPLLGAVIRAMGAFPVDIRRGQGRAAYEKAKELIEAGELVGLFPEGRRSMTGWMEPALREGAARLAWETGAPLVPATIAGAYRAWPHFRLLPHPARIKVRFHEPIDPRPHRAAPEEQALPALLAELRRRVDASLLPGVKADLRTDLAYRKPSPWPRNHESFPALAAAVVVFWKTRELTPVLPCYGYIAYLLLDHFLLPQSRLVKWVRNLSPVLFALGYGPSVLHALGRPAVLAERALVGVLCGAFFPYLYERGRTVLAMVRGFVLVAALEVAVLGVAPTSLGVHVALPLYLAAFAWDRRTVYSRWAVPILLAWTIGVPYLLGAPSFLMLVPHAAAAIVAALFTTMVAYTDTPKREEPVEVRTGLDLDLR
jgi:1-acyl-sn-glycerol-3-phosphate acyltransferase